MLNRCDGDRLSWGDSVFLNLEREGMPLNVASVFILEGKIPFRSYVRFVESKLPLIPRYFKRVVASPFNLGLPSWDYDPEFDIRNHVHELKLQHGSDADLKAAAGRILSKCMDRQHPLWDLTLVHGLKEDRTALVARMHHCLADGIAGVGIINVLMDPSPEVPPLPKRRQRLEVPPPRDVQSTLVDSLTSSYSNLVERLLAAWADILNIAERTLANGGNFAADEVSSLLPELTTTSERLRFNTLYRGPQKFAWSTIPLDEVKEIRHVCETSVNDVLLTLVTATIRRYSELHGDKVKGRVLRMMVPVNLRASDNSGELGNRISLVPVTVPLDIRDPRKLLAAVHQRTEFLKNAHAAELVSLAGGLLGMFPSPVQAVAGPMISRIPFTPFNMVCTNVPGPQFPLYVLGHKLLQWYPYVPVGGEMAVNCAILSYDGNVYFGFSGDSHIAPDLGRMEKLLAVSFKELQEGVRGNPSQPSRKRAPRESRATVKPSQAPAAVEPVPLPVQPAAAEPQPAPKPAVKQEEVPEQLIA